MERLYKIKGAPWGILNKDEPLKIAYFSLLLQKKLPAGVSQTGSFILYSNKK